MSSEITPAAYVKTTQVSDDEFLVEEVEPQDDEGGVPDADGVLPFTFEVEHVTFSGWVKADPPRMKVEVKILKVIKIFSKEFNLPKQGVKVSLGKGVFGYTGFLKFYLADKALKCDFAIHGKHLNITKNGIVLKHL